MLSPRSLLLVLSLPGALFIGYELGAAKTESVSGSKPKKETEGEIGILQKQVQMLQEQVDLLEQDNARLRTEDSGEAPTPVEPEPVAVAAEPASPARLEDLIPVARQIAGKEPGDLPRIEYTNEGTFRRAVRSQLVGGTPQRWTERETLWKRMGLLPEDCDLLGSFEDMVIETQPVLAQENGSLLVLSGAPLHIGQLVAPLSTLASGLHPSWSAMHPSDDLWLGRLALRLGEGALVRTLDAIGQSPGAQAGTAPFSDKEGPRFYRAPAAVRDLFTQLPQIGLRHHQKLHREGGWNAVQSSLATTLTTSAARNPERKKSSEGGWGELLTLLLLKQYLPESMALQAAEGWQSDRISLDGSGLRWETSWATGEDATQFFKALRKFQSSRHGNPITQEHVTEEGEHGRFRMGTPAGQLQIRYTDDRLGVILEESSRPSKNRP